MIFVIAEVRLPKTQCLSFSLFVWQLSHVFVVQDYLFMKCWIVLFFSFLWWKAYVLHAAVIFRLVVWMSLRFTMFILMFILPKKQASRLLYSSHRFRLRHLFVFSFSSRAWKCRIPASAILICAWASASVLARGVMHCLSIVFQYLSVQDHLIFAC